MNGQNDHIWREKQEIKFVESMISPNLIKDTFKWKGLVFNQFIWMTQKEER